MPHPHHGSAPPHAAARPARLDPRLERKLALYLMGIVLILVVAGALVAVGVMGWWSAGLEPVSDGDRVLEELRRGPPPSGDLQGEGSKGRP